MTIKRGQAYLANLDSGVGREIAKTKPVVVVSNDVKNEFAGTTTRLHSEYCRRLLQTSLNTVKQSLWRPNSNRSIRHYSFGLTTMVRVLMLNLHAEN